MLVDLRLSPYRKLPNIFAEVFGPYRPSDYAGVVSEHLTQRERPPLVLLALPTRRLFGAYLASAK